MEFLTSWAHANAIVVSATILIVAYIFIATEKIPKMTIALVGASLTLFLGLLGHSQKVGGEFDPHYFTDYLEKKIENVIEGNNKKSSSSVVRTKTKKEADKKTQKKKV